jgi:hypothetical protein
MPIYLRRFYYKKLEEYKIREKKEIEKTQKKQSNISKQSLPNNPRFNR